MTVSARLRQRTTAPDASYQELCSVDSPARSPEEVGPGPENELMLQQLEIYAKEFTRYYWERRRLEKELRDQVEELRLSRQRIVAVEEALRKEIAELLHGRVQTKLVVVWHRLGQCIDLLTTDMTKAKALLPQIRDEIDQIRERDVRQAAHLLHPSVIQIGVLPAVQTLISAYKDYFQIAVNADPQFVQMDNPLDNRIQEEARLIIYRVLEEGLSNIHRHARATAVDINLSVPTDDSLNIAIADNGVGFDVSHTTPGLGLVSIADRVGAGGGAWSIQSAVTCGTRLIVSLPLTATGPGRKSQGLSSRTRVA